MSATIELLQEGRYRINQLHSHAGTDNIYDAYDTVRDANVVVKEIPAKLGKVATASQQESIKAAFADQAKTLTEISHDSLLSVHDFFSEIGRQYLVMEAVDGDDLKELLDRNKSAFPHSDVLGWADELLDALHYLHTYQPPIIHKNVKPENINLNSAGKITLLGFGLTDGEDAKVSTSTRPGQGETANIRYSPLELIWQGLDSASQKVITNSYDERSERILKEPADPRSDIYALGATLYHLITATEPIDALERSIDLLEGKADPLREPTKVDPRIPPEISDVIMKALEIKRESRYDSAVIMRQVLKTAAVRVAEREEAEALEQEEAAEDLKMAHQTRHEQVRQLVEQKRIEIEAEQKKQNEILQEKLREAEEQRLLAEKRAAEIEQLLREKAELAEKADSAKQAEAERLAAAERAEAERKAEAEALAIAETAARAEAEAKAKAKAEAEAKAKAEAAARAEAAAKAEAEAKAKAEAAAKAEAKAKSEAAARAEATAKAEAAMAEASAKSEAAAKAEAEAAAIAAAAAKAEAEAIALAEEAREAERAAAQIVAEPEEEILEIEEAEVEMYDDGVMFGDGTEVEVMPDALSGRDLHWDDVASKIDDDPKLEAANSEEVSDTPPFASGYGETASGSKSMMPMIGIGVVVLLIAAVAGWFLMSSGSNKTPQTQPVQTAAPVQPAVQQAAVPEAQPSVAPETTQPQNEIEAAAIPAPAEQRPVAEPAQAKAKKPAAPAKAPEEKKKSVTVDDLINDN